MPPGFFITFNFFFFAFLLIFTKGEYPGFYFTESAHSSVFFYIAAGFLGSSLLYVSRLTAEKITRKSRHLKEKLLPIVSISSIICACLVYVIGTAAVNSGWLGGKDGHGLLYVTGQWFFFCAYFLGAFFLIVYSKFKKNEWKTVFFILPLIQSWAVRMLGEGTALFLTEFAVLIILTGLLFFADISPDHSKVLKG